jgi:hypothetical protein
MNNSILIIALAMLCSFSQTTEAKVKKTRKAKARTTQTTTVRQQEMPQESDRENDELNEIKSWIQGSWTYTTTIMGMRSVAIVTISGDNIVVKFDGQTAYSGHYDIIDNNSTIRYDHKKGSYYSTIALDKERKLLKFDERNYFKRL